MAVPVGFLARHHVQRGLRGVVPRVGLRGAGLQLREQLVPLRRGAWRQRVRQAPGPRVPHVFHLRPGIGPAQRGGTSSWTSHRRGATRQDCPSLWRGCVVEINTTTDRCHSRTPCPVSWANTMGDIMNVGIVGGGYAGRMALSRIAGAGHAVTLIDPRDHWVERTRLHEAARRGAGSHTRTVAWCRPPARRFGRAGWSGWRAGP